jgi:hypothetical protein
MFTVTSRMGVSLLRQARLIDPWRGLMLASLGA